MIATVNDLDEVQMDVNKDMDYTWNIKVYGIVQGVGFRPFVKRLGDSCGVKGCVSNKGAYVDIYINASVNLRDIFLKRLKEEAPERSIILRVDIRECKNVDFDDFSIIESDSDSGDIFVSVDIATCDKCRRELFNPADRRYMHPFINCTDCGPRLTILDKMPYDRERTSMKNFPMCDECAREYNNPDSRRYDAQPVCCNDCGPRVYFRKVNEDIIYKDSEAILRARRAIEDGKIVAVKGIGGFHLCCDATNYEAVERLRQLKSRPNKPFAVMVRDIETVKRECNYNDNKEIKDILCGHQKPILLLDKNENGKIHNIVAPDNSKIGIMLPYTPIHMLLFDYDSGDGVIRKLKTDCLVMTSGNPKGAPICKDEDKVIEEIGLYCDYILYNDRKIRLRADDTVMDLYDNKPYMIRRSRGYSPIPVYHNVDNAVPVLGIGGELKNSFCLGKNNLFYMSPYVGDMGDYRTVEALKEAIIRLKELLNINPLVIGADLHPKYNTLMVAKELSLPIVYVQHHFAHLVSCLVENDFHNKAIGVAFDGTGYGTDGSIWGGEVMILNTKEYKRVAAISSFNHIGGDIASKEGYRIALSMINDIYKENALEIVRKLNLAPDNMVDLYKKMAEKKINCITSTSAGRLFDAVSAVLGIVRMSTYEGEGAIKLEYMAEKYLKNNGKTDVKMHFGWHEDSLGLIIMETDKLFTYIIEEKLNGEPGDKLAYEFHAGLSEIIAVTVKELSLRNKLYTCALSGGVFQNKLLLGLVDEKLKDNNITVLKHSLVPPNDGGIGLGQAVVAANNIDNYN